MIDPMTVSLNFIKREIFTGSDTGMRYQLQKAGDEMLVTVWPEPYGFAKTDSALKTSETFPLSTEGRDEAVKWLNEQHELRKELWNSVHGKPLGTIM